MTTCQGSRKRVVSSWAPAVFIMAAVFAAGATPAVSAPIPGDLNSDGYVDQNDVAAFVSCASGSAIPHNGTGPCLNADFESDGDVDHEDFAILQVYLGSGEPPGNIWYVDINSGSDQNDGLSETTPFKNIGHAVAQAAAIPGDHVVRVAPGVYPESDSGENRLVVSSAWSGRALTIQRWGSVGIVSLATAHTADQIWCEQGSGATLTMEDINLDPVNPLSAAAIHVANVDCSLIARRLKATLPDDSYALFRSESGGGANRTFAFEDCDLTVGGTSAGYIARVQDAASFTWRGGTAQSRWGCYFNGCKVIEILDGAVMTFNPGGTLTIIQIAAGVADRIEVRNSTLRAADGNTQGIRVITQWNPPDWFGTIRIQGTTLTNVLPILFPEYLRRLEVTGNTITSDRNLAAVYLGAGATPIVNKPDYCVIQGNTFDLPGTAAGPTAVAVGRGWDGTQILRNVVKHAGQLPMLIYADFCGVHHNIMRGHSDPINLRGASHCHVTHNTTYPDSMSAFWLSYDNGANTAQTSTRGARFNVITDNIFVSNYAYRYALAVNIDGYNTPGYEATTWYNYLDNNIYWNTQDPTKIWKIDGVDQFAGETGLGDRDAGVGLRGFWKQHYVDGPLNDLASIAADPLFVDPANGDFSTQPASPARGAATDGSDIGAVQSAAGL